MGSDWLQWTTVLTGASDPLWDMDDEDTQAWHQAVEAFFAD